VLTTTPKRVALTLSTTTNLPPIILSIGAVSLTNVILSWNSVSNLSYRVQYKNSLNDLEWSNQIPDIYSVGTVTSATNSLLGNQPQRFYRVQLIP